MSDIPEHVQKILDDFKQTLVERIELAQMALADLNMIERRYGLDVTTIGSLDIEFAQIGSGLPRETLSDNRSAMPARSASVAIGSFVGSLPLEAAKKYIDMTRRAVEFSEIVDAIVKGNAAIPQGSAWQEDLELRLSRSPDVLKVSDHTYALTKYYTEEQIKAARNARRPAAFKKAKKKKKKKARKARAGAIIKEEKRPPELKLLESPAKNTTTETEHKIAPERARDTSGA